MSDRRVVLHIGTEKTGTTAIQRFLSRNRRALDEQGFHYSDIPNGINHLSLAAYAVDAARPRDFHHLNDVTADNQTAFRARIKEELSSELDTGHALILSNEHLSSRAVESTDLDRISDLFHGIGADVTVVVYLRRLVPMIEASHSTYVKSGRTLPFDLDAEVSWRARYDLNALVERWDMAFPGKVNVRLYREENKQDRSAIIRDFLEAAGVEFTSAFTLPARSVNPSLPRAATELGRLINQVPREVDTALDERIRRLYNLAAEKHAVGPAFHLTRVQAMTVNEAYQESLHALRPRIGDEAVDYLINDQPSAAELPPVTDDERASAVGALMRAIKLALEESTASTAADQAEEFQKTIDKATLELDSLRHQLETANQELSLARAAADELERVRATRVWRWSAPARKIVARLRGRR